MLRQEQTMTGPRTYVVLVERTIDSDIGDHVFVLLGFYDAVTASAARKQARTVYALSPQDVLVSAPTTYWSVG